MRAFNRIGTAFILLSMTFGCRHAQDGSAEGSLVVAGRERTFLYHLPPQHGPQKKWPLVVALHGRGGTGLKMEATGLSTLADREGFVVVYPDGFRRSWNDARGGSPASAEGVDDVGFIRSLINDSIATKSVDFSRVYVLGVSNGGMMSFRLACELSDKIAAVGSVIGLMPQNGAAQCEPAHPMPMMIVAGTDDPLVPYNGGDINGQVLSASATREKWASINGCEPADVRKTQDNKDDETRIHSLAHTRCKSGSEVVLHSIEGGGHTWPGGAQYLPEVFIGRVSHEMNATEELWAFFKRHSLPESARAAQSAE